MQLFLSYSRDDADTVHRLVERLERTGHTTWLDTDDIVGSDAWRASIVEGLRAADAVVLVLSPRSMASTYVEREVVLAAELRRPVVPVLLEETGLTDSVLFELAGRQQVRFAGRPFDDGVTDLLAALAEVTPRGAAPASPAPSPSPGPGRNRRRLATIGAATAVVAALAIAALARRDDDRGGPTVDAAAVTAAGATTATTATTGSTGSPVALAAQVWYAGFRIEVTSYAHDAAAERVTVTLRATSDQDAPADPATLFDGDATLEWPGGRAVGSCACSTRLPRGALAPVTATFAVDATFDRRAARLVFGDPTQHLARVPLDGGPVTGDVPIDRELTGTLDDGAGTTFTVERVRVLPAVCRGLADAVELGPALEGTWSVLVTGTVRYDGTYPTNFGVATLTGPDGVTVGSSTLAASVYALDPGVPRGGVGICFPVTGPVAGAYRVRAAARDIPPAQDGFVITL